MQHSKHAIIILELYYILKAYWIVYLSQQPNKEVLISPILYTDTHIQSNVEFLLTSKINSEPDNLPAGHKSSHNERDKSKKKGKTHDASPDSMDRIAK